MNEQPVARTSTAVVNEVAQRFRPYCCHSHGGHDGQVRTNPKGMYVRWQDYERLRVALHEIVSMTCVSGVHDTGDPVTEIARKALDCHIDWDRVLRGTSPEPHCRCYGHEGDTVKCPQHGVRNAFE